MSYILHIETATDICSVALGKSGELIREHHATEIRMHISSLSVLIDEILGQEQLTYRDLAAIAVSTGPGSYTGLRVGYATAKGLAIGLEIPIIEVDTLYSIAWGMKQVCRSPVSLFVPMIDARRMEVYSAQYDENLQRVKDAAPWILDENSLSDLLERYDTVAFGGNGAFKVEDLFFEVSVDKVLLFSQIECNSTYLVAPAWRLYTTNKWADTAYCEPRYIKPPNITKPKIK